jgi:hypothetical protein
LLSGDAFPPLENITKKFLPAKRLVDERGREEGRGNKKVVVIPNTTYPTPQMAYITD